MKYDLQALKNKIANGILVAYYSLAIVLSIIAMPDDFSILEKVVHISGTFFGLGFRSAIILLYWFTIVPRYIKEGNKVNIIQLFAGILLIEIGSGFITLVEIFIVLSIVIILKKNYRIFANSTTRIQYIIRTIKNYIWRT